jgi:arabinan endo-1,5-alpha-L-arabinosidase
MLNAKRIFVAVILALIIGSAGSTVFGIDLYFENDVHDPATITKDGDIYWTFCTGGGIQVRYSLDLLSWQHADDPVFPYGTWPSWVDTYVPGFAGNFWAPDVIYMNNKYYLYYSCFYDPGTGFKSAIGVCVSDSLNNPDWLDLGMVVSSTTEPLTSHGEPINCIDPGLFKDASGNVWMTFGSYYGGIFIIPIDPTTGKRIGSTRYGVAGNSGWWSGYEGSQATYINGYYYLFANLGSCCLGDDSTYYIVVGRSTSPTGPYLNKSGGDLWSNHLGSTVLSTSGKYIGPGHYGYYNNNGQNLVSIHYYDGDSTHGDGWPARLDLLQMSFDTSNWPVLTRDFTISGSSAPTPVTASLQNGEIRKIQIRHSGKMLDVVRVGGIPQGSDGTNVLQWTNLNDDTQKWVFNKITEPVDCDYYWSIHPAHAVTEAIDVVSFGQADGTNAALWTYWGGNCQQWRFVDMGDGWYQMVPRHSSKRLSIDDGSTADGANAEQWRSNPAWYYQHFRFVDGGSYECSDVDIYSDGIIDFKDYCLLAANWLQQGSSLDGDITGNTIVNTMDLKALVSYWLQTCE